MRRVVIIGSTGTGKSTLARAIAAQRGLPVVELDDLYHLPGWKIRDEADCRRLANAATEGETWIAVGNYNRLRDITWARADTLVWLDYPFWLTFRQLLSRSLARIRDKQAICNGNTETWGKFLSKDSIMVWLCASWRRNRKRYGAVFSNPQDWPRLALIRHRTPEETARWLAGLS